MVSFWSKEKKGKQSTWYKYAANTFLTYEKKNATNTADWQVLITYPVVWYHSYCNSNNPYIFFFKKQTIHWYEF